MDYTGLVSKYPIYRDLTDEERYNKLDPKKRLDVKLLDQLCVIKINSIFLESVDKYFGYKGVTTLFNLIIFIAFFSMILWLTWLIFIYQWDGLSSDQRLSAFLAWFGSLLVCSLLVFISSWLLRKEAFAWTHYPIRLNRKNRMVYVFRTNGTVLSVPWDEVFFTLSFDGSVIGNIQGHVLDKRNQQVLETFAFSAVSASREILLGHWEFLRRYMEEGPQAVFDEVVYCMPIDGQYESFQSGMERTFANDSRLPVILQLFAWPLDFLSSLARFFAMRTSKIPTWPQDVEDACPIDPNDPYIKDSRINPTDLQ